MSTKLDQESHEQPAADVRLEEGNYQQVANIFVNDVRDKKINALDVMVYMVFLDRQRNKKHSWVSCPSVARTVGTTTRNVNRCIKRLRDAGHLTREGETKYGTRFTCATTRVEGGKVLRAGVQIDNAKLPKPAFATDNVFNVQTEAANNPIPSDDQKGDLDLGNDIPKFLKPRFNKFSRPQIEPEENEESTTDDDVPF